MSELTELSLYKESQDRRAATKQQTKQEVRREHEDLEAMAKVAAERKRKELAERAARNARTVSSFGLGRSKPPKPPVA